MVSSCVELVHALPGRWRYRLHSATPIDWDRFERCRQRLHNGEAEAVGLELQALRQRHAEPAIATVLADALAALGRPHEAIATLEADINEGIDNHWTHYTLGHHHAAHHAR